MPVPAVWNTSHCPTNPFPSLGSNLHLSYGTSLTPRQDQASPAYVLVLVTLRIINGVQNTTPPIRSQNVPPQNTPLSHIGYVELILLKNRRHRSSKSCLSGGEICICKSSLHWYALALFLSPSLSRRMATSTYSRSREKATCQPASRLCPSHTRLFLAI